MTDLADSLLLLGADVEPRVSKRKPHCLCGVGGVVTLSAFAGSEPQLLCASCRAKWRAPVLLSFVEGDERMRHWYPGLLEKLREVVAGGAA